MLSTPELLIILLIIIVVFGASKLPKLGEALGKSIKNFKSSVQDPDETDKIEDASIKKDAKEKDSEKDSEK
ncbi:MAG: twin-arginine translocase TatA/TatE family subunit [Deltaproteobacteria bacterium]|jgi:sec-independent protein translocase protein TatA|nr:twin-arginine translocase TatA/TatE family subunit [Deltaproteobacteria bacterium]